MGRGPTQAGIDMTGEGMTSVSVSYEIRRQLNTLRTTGGHRSVNELLAEMIRTHKMLKMKGEIDTLRERMKMAVDVDVEHLAERLNMAPLPGVMLHDVVAPSCLSLWCEGLGQGAVQRRNRPVQTADGSGVGQGRTLC